MRKHRRQSLGDADVPSRRYSPAARKRRLFVMTETELKLMAAAAIMEFKNKPKNGREHLPRAAPQWRMLTRPLKLTTS